MKKILSIILCVAMLLSSAAFTAFAEDPSDAAQAVIEMIQALDENSTTSQIREAIDAYEALSEEDKEQVWNFKHIEELEAKSVEALIASIDELGDLMYIDYYWKNKSINEYYSKYDALSDASKAKVTNADKLLAAKEKVAGLIEWNENKNVNLLNSALRGFAKYDIADIRDFAARESIGVYYYFEEVDTIYRGDSTTGYYQPEESDMALVRANKYAQLEFDVKFTDIDVINGWPAPFKVTNGGDGYSGYDFVNGVFFQGSVSNMDHGYLCDFTTMTEYDMDFGVWHHFVVTYDNDKITYVVDGEEILNADINGVYDFIIVYPWLCSLEMTNVYLRHRNGKETLSALKTPADYDYTGWIRSTNDSDATMLDLVQESLNEAREKYDNLSADEKERVVGIEQLDRVQALIDAVREGKNGIVVIDGSADVEYAAKGATVTLTANAAPEGTKFYQWEIVSGEFTIADVNAASTTFVMPDTAVEIRATYIEKPAFTPGDADGDGFVNARDVILTMKAALPGFVAPADFVFDAANLFNEDDTINARDVIEVMKAALAAATGGK